MTLWPQHVSTQDHVGAHVVINHLAHAHCALRGVRQVQVEQTLSGDQIFVSFVYLCECQPSPVIAESPAGSSSSATTIAEGK